MNTVSYPIALYAQDYCGWSGTVWIERGPLSLVLAPQVGGRILGLRWHDRDVFWVNESLAQQSIDVGDCLHPGFDKVGLGFLLWGGDKTWLSPQSCWINELPFFDLDSGAYDLTVLEQTSDRVVIRMNSPVCRESGIQIARTVEVSGSVGSWTVIHDITNKGDRPAKWGVWGNSMVARPATVYLPVNPRSKYPDGVKTFVDEGESVSARTTVVTTHHHIASIECVDPLKFKYGVDSRQGAILAVLPDNKAQSVGYMKHFPVSESEPYGHGCVAEVFNAAEHPYLEVEIHSPVRDLAPGATYQFTEVNRVFDISGEVSTQIDALFSTPEDSPMLTAHA